MTRREDWPELLIETIARHATLPFGWGASDCFLLPMDCVLAMTGADPWPEVRGSYSTEMGAARQLRQRGFATLDEAFASTFAEIPPAFAGRGDIGIVDSPRGLAGVVFMDNGAIGKAEMGVRRVPRASVLRAFKV